MEQFLLTSNKALDRNKKMEMQLQDSTYLNDAKISIPNAISLDQYFYNPHASYDYGNKNKSGELLERDGIKFQPKQSNKIFQKDQFLYFS